jgi:hypothetical protein
MDAPLFEERQTFYWPYMLVLAGLMAFALYCVKTNPNARATDEVMVPLTAAIGLLAATGFSSMQTKITRREMQFGFPMWRKRVPLTSLEVEGIEELKLWYGIGVHWLGDKWVFNVHMGEGVKIRVKGQSYLIGSRNPEQLRHTLLQLARERVTL